MKIRYSKYFIIVSATSLFLFTNCSRFDLYFKNYENLDASAIYSTNPFKPFKYGYAYTKKQCEENFSQDVIDFNLKNGDVVADVGAASGWIEGALSVLLDSTTFYVQDINPFYLNESEFSKVINYYSRVRSTPQTNKFYFIIGKERKTLLPDSMFDKVILINTIHEIKFRNKIIKDLRTKLKPNGSIIINEPFSNEFKVIRHIGCNIKAFKVSKVIEFMKHQGFYLTKMTEPENSFMNCLTFKSNISISKKYFEQRDSIQMYINELDKLNKKEICSDSSETFKIACLLKENIAKINSVYSSVENYINTIGYNLLKDNKYQSAINVFKINILVYPQSADVFDRLGEAYLKNKQYKLALSNYLKSIEIKPDNLEVIKNIEQLNKLLNNVK